MEKTDEKHKILVIGSDTEFIEMSKKTLASSYDVIYAMNADEGLEKARKERPNAILLGYLEPRGTSFEVHKKLCGGWITKHIPLLVVDVQSEEHLQKGWSREEAMQLEAEDYIAISMDDDASLLGFVKSVDLGEKVEIKLRENVNAFKEIILDPNIFCVTWEQIPGRGAFEMQQEEVIEYARTAAESGKIHALSVTDNPGGNPALSTEMLCAAIKKLGMEPLVHLACRDKNRNEIESMLSGVAAEGVRNLLVLTGDYPSSEGFEGKAKPVFDIDPVNVLRLIEKMNAGLEIEVMRKKVKLAATDFFAGVCVSPFKITEQELMTQYYKLEKKIQAGAKFIITQVGYDARKYHELLQWLKINGHDIPVIANLYVMPYGTAKVMNANQIPGCVVIDKFVSELAEEAKDKATVKAKRVLKSAKMYAIAKGMGCAGAHIGGHGVTFEMVEEIISRGEELSKDWEKLVAEFDYPQTNGFYLFERDSKTGLNTEVFAGRPLKKGPPMKYRFARIAHSLLFNEKSWRFKMLKPVLARVDKSHAATHFLEFNEHMAKVAMFQCMNCGDCALFDLAYICPMSQCPKNQRNGPCGGSYNGWCEVYPNEKKCVWVQAYERLKAYKEEYKLGAYIVPPCNWELWQTSSWLNFYLGRDHIAKRLGIQPPQAKSSQEKSSITTVKAPLTG